MNKYIITLAITACFLCFNNHCFSNEIQNNSKDISYTYTKKASDKFMMQDFQGAIECLNEAIRISPNNPMLYLNRGFIKQVAKNYQDAMQDYNSAISINPKFSYAYNNRAVLKVAMNDIQGALADYETALSFNPKYSEVYYNRGNLRYMTDNLKAALEDYNKAIELNPNDSEAYNNRGVVKKRLNYNVGALSDYSKAIAINPKDSIAYANRGRLKKLYFDNEGATIDLNQAIALAENQTFIKNVKPLLSEKQYIAAIPGTSFAYDFTDNEAKPHQQKIAMANVNTINTYTSKQKQEIISPQNSTPKIDIKTIANKKESETSKVSPSNTPLINAGVGKVALQTAPDIRTTTVTNQATTNLKLAESYYIRGLQKCILHDMQGAISDLDKAIANNSKYADAYLYRAAIKKELGDKEGFRKDYSTAIQINPALQSYNDSNLLSLI